MTLLWVDGFDGYKTTPTVADITPYTSDLSGAEGGGVSPGGDYPRVKVAQSANGSGNQDGYKLDVSSFSTNATWIVGMRIKFNEEGAGLADEQVLVDFKDSSGDVQCSIGITPADTLVAWKNDSGSDSYGPANFGMITNIWYHFEFKVVFNATTGSIVARVNEEEVLNLTGLNTSDTIAAENYPSEIEVAASARFMPIQIDDFYIMDGAGSTNNDFLGDVGVESLFPDGNGNSSQLTGSDGNSTDNYLLVDETEPDDDTTYVESSTSTHKDTYTFGNLSGTPASIAGVAVTSYGKFDSGSASFDLVVRSNTTEQNSAAITAQSSYIHQQAVFEQDPDTTAAWTASGVNAMEAGYEVQ